MSTNTSLCIHMFTQVERSEDEYTCLFSSLPLAWNLPSRWGRLPGTLPESFCIYLPPQSCDYKARFHSCLFFVCVCLVGVRVSGDWTQALIITIEPSLPFPFGYAFYGSIAVPGLLDAIELEGIRDLSCSPALSVCPLFFSSSPGSPL